MAGRPNRPIRQAEPRRGTQMPYQFVIVIWAGHIDACRPSLTEFGLAADSGVEPLDLNGQRKERLRSVTTGAWPAGTLVGAPLGGRRCCQKCDRTYRHAAPAGRKHQSAFGRGGAGACAGHSVSEVEQTARWAAASSGHLQMWPDERACPDVSR
eukprot:1178814-Prorocentrum_minimum.AAC.1